MGKRWRKYAVGKYRLGHLNGQAVVVWEDEAGPHRRRLGVCVSEVEARAKLDLWVSRVTLLKERESKTVRKAFMAAVASAKLVAVNVHDDDRRKVALDLGAIIVRDAYVAQKFLHH